MGIDAAAGAKRPEAKGADTDPGVGIGGRRLGAIIAGGRARRFGGDKALAHYRGAPLIDHAIAALRPFVSEIVVCGRTHETYESLADVPAPGLGPLGGISAALAHARLHGIPGVLTAPCDMPDIPGDLLQSLLSVSPSVCAAQPLLGHWPAALAESLDTHLRADPDRSLRRWMALSGAVPIPYRELPNVNRPADLAALDAR